MTLFKAQSAMTGTPVERLCLCCGDKIPADEFTQTGDFPGIEAELIKRYGRIDRVCSGCADDHTICAYCKLAVLSEGLATATDGERVCWHEHDEYEHDARMARAEVRDLQAEWRASV